jgi:hypothetical protein
VLGIVAIKSWKVSYIDHAYPRGHIGFTTVPRIGFLPVTESVARSRLTLGEHHDPSSATNLSEEIQ